MKNVVIFSDAVSPQISGVASTYTRVCSRLKAEGYSVYVCGPTYGVKDEHVDYQAPSVPLWISKNIQIGFPNLFKLYKVVKNSDLVHVATEGTLGLAGLLLAKIARKPVVMAAHTDYDFYVDKYQLPKWSRSLIWKYLQIFYGRAHSVLVAGEKYRQTLIYHTGLKNTITWWRGVSDEEFNENYYSTYFRKLVNAKDTTKVILYVGRLAPEKDIDILIESFLSLRNTGQHDIRLVIVGEGIMREQLESTYQDAHIFFLGVLRGEQLASAYASSDIFAFPSASETFGNVVIEAMMSKLPVLVVNKGGVRDIVVDDSIGSIAEHDYTSFKNKLEELILDEQLRVKYIQNGFNHVSTHYGWTQCMTTILDEYNAAYERHHERR